MPVSVVRGGGPQAAFCLCVPTPRGRDPPRLSKERQAFSGEVRCSKQNERMGKNKDDRGKIKEQNRIAP